MDMHAREWVRTIGRDLEDGEDQRAEKTIHLRHLTEEQWDGMAEQVCTHLSHIAPLPHMAFVRHTLCLPHAVPQFWVVQIKPTIPTVKAHCDQATIDVLEARRNSGVVVEREEKKRKAMHNKYAKEGKSIKLLATSTASMPQVL